RGWLFCTLAGGRMNDRYVRNMLGRMAERAGIDKRVHPHGFRHTFAAELVQEGELVTTVRDALGHASLAVTDRYLRRIGAGEVDSLGARRTARKRAAESDQGPAVTVNRSA